MILGFPFNFDSRTGSILKQVKLNMLPMPL